MHDHSSKINTHEDFKPRRHLPPTGFFNAIRFTVRLMVDVQVVSVYRHVKSFLPAVRGKLLDAGCGESPYRFLLPENKIDYFGIDIARADAFDCRRTDIALFDGKRIPFDDEFFDAVLCTEVLEHVEDPQTFLSEIHRVLKPDGKALITIPWSARYHYIPHDYFRYTPSALKKLFSAFKEIKIFPRGTDVTAIMSKIIVLFFRNIFPRKKWRYVFFPFWLMATPLIICALILGHVSLLIKVGSDSDPIGYTVIVKK